MQEKMNNRVVYIYILIDPRDESVKYVGRSYHLKNRLSQHNKIWEPRTKKEKWIKELHELGHSPEIESIEKTDEENWSFWEMHYISLFKSFGFDLTNSNGGGIGCYNPSIETREKMRNNMLNASQSHKNRLSKSIKGRVYSDEHRKKLSDRHAHVKNENLRKPIIQFDKDWNYIREWVSVSEASRFIKNSTSIGGTICTAIRKGTRAYGFRWKYKSDYYRNPLLEAVKKIPMFN